ncbi:MAG: DUF192 domain-containing protein [Acidobacteria bacterium]|nr:DUF192 domain-containing protein [Acidobacteriota bacterium]
MRSTFLAPLRSGTGRRLILTNRRTGLTVADAILPALDSRSRRTGLLLHQGLPSGTAMLIAPTSAIHTWFMRFAIDVAFLARDGRVMKIRSAVPPWRMIAAWRGYVVLEMAAGALERTGTRVGDRLELIAAREHHAA